MGKTALYIEEDVAGAAHSNGGGRLQVFVAERTGSGAIEVFPQMLLQPAAGIINGITFAAVEEVSEEGVLDGILGKGGITAPGEEARIAKERRGIKLVDFEDFAMEIDLRVDCDMEPLLGGCRGEAGGVVEGVGNTGS